MDKSEQSQKTGSQR